jgi:hypothetical protein
MNWENVSPMAVQLMAQLLHLQTQLVNQPIEGVSPANLIGAIGDFINQIGEQIQKEAT